MALGDRSRSFLASVVGWIIVAVVVWILLRFVVGTVRWLLRGFVLLIVIGALAWAYASLKAPPDRNGRDGRR